MDSPFSVDALRIDPASECTRIVDAIRAQLGHTLRRRGIVLGLSGGIDSSVTAALAARAVGPQRVLGLLMPERNSEPQSSTLGRVIGDSLGIACIEEDITSILEAAGFYDKYDKAVREIFPGYGPGWKSKLAIESLTDGKRYTTFTLVAENPEGIVHRERLPATVYLAIVAATNLKQRTRKMVEYHHADRLNYAVAGTPNRLEYDQGFFVKNGDGAADLKPIAHLYKTQVYQLAEYLGIPATIRERPPTTDTFSMPQGQDEFYFTLPYREMDLCLFGKNNGVAAGDVARAAGLEVSTVERAWADIDRKRDTTRYQHLAPLLVTPITEIFSDASSPSLSASP